MLHTFCAFSSDYPTTLRNLSSPIGMSSADVIVQFPYSLAVCVPSSEPKSVLMTTVPGIGCSKKKRVKKTLRAWRRDGEKLGKGCKNKLLKCGVKRCVSYAER